MNGEQTLKSTKRGFPIREDCWSEEASYTLIEAWGDRHLELKRGNLRQKHWQEVADAVNASHGTVKEAQRTVNASHGTVKEAQRTDIQCKNRIDTLKKKYKLEKARILGSGGTVKSNWRFYDQLDALVGDYVNPKKCQHQPAPLAVSIPYRKTQLSLPHELVIPVGVRSSRREKRSSISVNDSFSRRNYSAVAAAAAADPVDSDSSRSSSESSRPRGDEEVDGIMEMAQAILGFAEIYERVEEEKQSKILELEKERIEFMKKLEYQRMQLIMDSQIQIEKIKRAKRASTTDIHE